MRKLFPVFCLVFAVMLAGCAATPETPASSPAEAAEEAVVLFDTDTCKIVLDGAQTTVEDKTNGARYEFTTTKTLTTKRPTLEQLQARCIARTSADTETVKIELAGALIVVTDKTTGQVYYINR